MNNMNNKNIEASYDDEIDLIKLMFDLWKRKLTIIGVTVIFAIASIAYALLAPQVWTSKSLIVAPNTQSVMNYLLYVQKYNTLLDSKNASFTPNQIFQKYEQELVSFDLTDEFFTTTPLYKEMIAKGMTKPQALDALFKQLVIAKPENKKNTINVNNLAIDFSANDPAVAQSTLKNFLEYVETAVYNRILNDYVFQVKMKKIALESEMNNIDQAIKSTRKIKIENLTNALNIAKNAGIKHYVEKFNDRLHPNNVSNDSLITIQDNSMYNNNFLFLLGEQYLTAQLNILKERPLDYPNRYYDIQYKLNKLSSFEVKSDQLKFKAFDYQESPTYPVQRVKPKRALIVIAGTFVGGILGVLFALLLNAIANYKANLTRKKA